MDSKQPYMHPNLKKLAFWLKVQIKFIFIGLLAISVFLFGIVITVLAIIFGPFLGWLGKRRFESRFYKKRKSYSDENSSNSGADYVDVEYEIIDEREEKK